MADFSCRAPLALAAAKRLSFAGVELRQGRWHSNSLRPVSLELYGKKIGYIGFGQIAQAAAESFKVFGTSGLSFDPYSPEDLERDARLEVKKAGFEEVLSSSDIISIHTPLTKETHHLISEAQSCQPKNISIIRRACS